LAVLSHHPMTGVGRCPLAIGLGMFAGLLFGVSGCRPASPLSESFSPIVQWGGFALARRRVVASSTVKGVSAPTCQTLSLVLSAGQACCVHWIASAVGDGGVT
jgi:hypothetical protein